MISSANICEQVIGQYLGQLKSGFVVNRAGNVCFIVTPFSRPDGESVELALELESDGRIVLNDMGDTLGYLHVHGLMLSRSLLESTKRTCQRFGVSLQGPELVIETEDRSGIGEALHMLTQAVLSVTDMIQKRRPMERARFDDEVESFIILEGVTYDADYAVGGKKGLHTVRFHVNTGRDLLIQPLSAAAEPVAFSWAERWAYRFNDIREANSKWQCVAVLDDRGERAAVWTTRALKPLEDFSVHWRSKEPLSKKLHQPRQGASLAL